jgi:hypothetical protein
MTHNVLIVLKFRQDRALIRFFRHLQASRAVAYDDLRREHGRSKLYNILQYAEAINREVGSRTGTYLFVKEKKRLGKHKFENLLRIQTELEFVDAGSLVLVQCAGS